MGSNGANDDDTQEQSGDQTGNAVQYDHGNGGRRRFPQYPPTSTATALALAYCRIAITGDVGWQPRQNAAGVIAILHGIGGSIAKVIRAESASGGVQAVHNDSNGRTVEGQVEGLASTDLARIGAIIARDVSDCRIK